MFQSIFIFFSISKQRVYSASWFPQNKDQTPNTKKQTKRLPEELTKKQSRKERTEEIMRTSRSMGGKRQSMWDTGGPVPAVRCQCHTIHTISLAPPNHWSPNSDTWDSPSETEPSPHLHPNRGGVRMGVVLGGLEMGGRWGKNLCFTYFLSFRKLFQFYFSFYWPGTPSSFSAQRRKPPDYRPVGASSTLEQLSGRGWSCC